MALNGGYNTTAQIVDGKFTFNYPIVKFIFLGTFRAFSDAYESNDFHTASLQGSSRRRDETLWGFEFTVPMSFLGNGI
ncbi:MAG: hypothetical protein ACLFQA_08490 [Bacteroidales bacterium]